MKNDPQTHIATVLTTALLALSAGMSGIRAADFDSGSTGEDGALEITADTTLQLPPDGIFNYTSVTIAEGATLTFTPNSLNTPVYMLATEDVTIKGDIDVSGEQGTRFVGGAGGPGGFQGGAAASNVLLAGDGHGPGRGQANDGNRTGSAGIFSPASGSSSVKKSYGTPILVPLIGGSGGGANGTSWSGGGGGGAILIACNSTVTINGAVRSHGGGSSNFDPNYGRGSGGAVRIAASKIVGTGTIDARAATTQSYGYGWVRLDSTDLREAGALQLYGTYSAGSFMTSIPENIPSLHIAEAAGQAIEEFASERVSVLLPFGSDATQSITVKATNFRVPNNTVPVKVVLMPEHGAMTETAFEILVSAEGTGEATVEVEFPFNIPTHVYVWSDVFAN